jgi:hypothetical protein
MSENEIPEVDTELKNVETFARSNPNNLPPQYNGDPEKFIKSWKDMRAEITRLQQAGKQPTPPEPVTQDRRPDADVSVPDLKIPDKPVQPNEDEWNKWGVEISNTGNVSQETRSAIKSKFGIPDQILDTYVDGIRAKQRQLATEAAGVVGGPDELKSVIQWATDNLPDAERDAVNSALKQPGWQNVLLGIKARRDATNTEPKTRVVGSSGVPVGVKPFANSKEMVAAMRDPRYKFDSDYQNLVQERVRITGHSKNG